MIYKGGYINGKKHLRTYLGSVLKADYTDVTALDLSYAPYNIGFVKKEMSVDDEEYLEAWPKYGAKKIGSENEFKVGSFLNDNGTYYWAELDNLFSFAQSVGITDIHAHCPLWYADFHPFFKALLTNPNGYAIGKAKVYEMYAALFNRYKGKIRTADIVNEQIKDDGTEIQTGWRELFGDDLWEIAFGAAQAADPNVLALITDFNYETGNLNRTNTTISIINRLKSKGIKVDGIGFQFHTTLGQNLDVARGRFRIWDKLNLKVMITELDVRTNVGGRGTTYTPTMAKEVSAMYVGISDGYIKAMRPVNRLGILTWSVSDRRGENFYNPLSSPIIIHHGGLFDTNIQPKLAYDDLIASYVRPVETHEIYQDFELGDIGSGTFIGSRTEGTKPTTWTMVSSDTTAKAHVLDDGMSMAQTQVDVFNHIILSGSSSNFIASTKNGTVYNFDVRVMNFAFRFVDANNMFCIQAYKSGSTDVYRLIKRKSGQDIVLHTSSIKPVYGQVIEVIANGSNIRYSIDGVHVTSITDSDFSTSTKFGYKMKGHFNADKYSSYKFIKYDPIT